MIWSDIPGWFDWTDIYDDWARRSDETTRIVEVGVWRGRSIAYLGSKLRELWKFPKLLGVDSWEPSEVLELKSHQDEAGGALRVFAEALGNISTCGLSRWVLLHRECSVDAAARLPLSSVDFCFIDGDHSYESVLSDIEAWTPKMRAGGQMAGHDYTDNWPGVRRAVDEFFKHRARLVGNCWVVDF